MSLTPVQSALLQQMDGRRTIREIVAAATETGAIPPLNLAEVEEFAKTLFQSLWQLDFVAMGLRPGA
jgi:hypothetical protein